jgi:hypothetical protein
LETVCLKCLRKSPGDRYTSAEALAADLRRFLDGAPIQARRPDLLTRAWYWCRRPDRLRDAGLIHALLLLVNIPTLLLLEVRCLLQNHGTLFGASPWAALAEVPILLGLCGVGVWIGVRTIAGRGYAVWIGFAGWAVYVCIFGYHTLYFLIVHDFRGSYWIAVFLNAGWGAHGVLPLLYYGVALYSYYVNREEPVDRRTSRAHHGSEP